MLRAALLALLVSAAPALAQEAATATTIGVHDPYAITPVPGAPTGAAYMLIHNHSSEADRLLGARTPAARSAELHHHIEDEGVMRMRPVEGGLELRPGSVLLLGRGGAHVMLMGLTEPLVDGATFPLTLIFEKAGEIEVEVPVDLARLTEAPADQPDAGEAHDHGEAAHEHAEEAHDHGEEAGHEGH
jgi:hypothetical protein